MCVYVRLCVSAYYLVSCVVGWLVPEARSAGLRAALYAILSGRRKGCCASALPTRYVCLLSLLRRYDKCTDCTCKQPDGCTAVCEHRAWFEDGYCDDGNNNCGCGWDGGDCCSLDANYNFCTDCECLNPKFGSYYYDTGS